MTTASDDLVVLLTWLTDGEWDTYGSWAWHRRTFVSADFARVRETAERGTKLLPMLHDGSKKVFRWFYS